MTREENSLGLSIVGGSDHSSHPFGVNAPGVFISKISLNSPAARSQRLRIGDRILEVNGTDVRNARHQSAVEVFFRTVFDIFLGFVFNGRGEGIIFYILDFRPFFEGAGEGTDVRREFGDGRQ